MRHSLRVRLLIIVLFGMGLLAAINLATSVGQLFRVRDQAIANSSQTIAVKIDPGVNHCQRASAREGPIR